MVQRVWVPRKAWTSDIVSESCPVRTMQVACIDSNVTVIVTYAPTVEASDQIPRSQLLVRMYMIMMCRYISIY